MWRLLLIQTLSSRPFVLPERRVINEAVSWNFPPSRAKYSWRFQPLDSLNKDAQKVWKVRHPGDFFWGLREGFKKVKDFTGTYRSGKNVNAINLFGRSPTPLCLCWSWMLLTEHPPKQIFKIVWNFSAGIRFLRSIVSTTYPRYFPFPSHLFYFSSNVAALTMYSFRAPG